ncbi:NAD(P)-binding protein [Mollisia scopiformis]|uniref:NAD(P)-binding protein n=1 Tax=Mollisia scopiformis TaxID=149040 RepID=A0A132BF91_MOLSC|nr:NAD(P)-binding protein [Mollisia scopiformis]KUJ10377.1 NAD(P)-binding protein [Mollisia scopiformis]
MALTSILVLGPTGGFGQFLVPELIRRKAEFQRIGAFTDTTRPQSAEKTKILQDYTTQGVEIVEGSYGDPAAFRGFQVVIACLGNHALKTQPAIIDTALAAGVTHFYPSEFGADLTVGDNWNERYYRDKVLTRNHLKTVAAETPRFGYTYFINGRFTEWAPIPHFGINLKTHTAHIVGRPEMEQSLLATNDAAKYLVCTLLDPPTEQERTYRFLGGNYSWTTIFSTLEKIQGVKWNVTYKSVEEARENQRKAIESGDVDAELAASHQVIQGTGRTLLPGPYDNVKFPEVKPVTLEYVWTEMLKDEARYFSLMGL